jgi:hypothetical protein
LRARLTAALARHCPGCLTRRQSTLGGICGYHPPGRGISIHHGGGGSGIQWVGARPDSWCPLVEFCQHPPPHPHQNTGTTSCRATYPMLCGKCASIAVPSLGAVSIGCQSIIPPLCPRNPLFRITRKASKSLPSCCATFVRRQGRKWPANIRLYTLKLLISQCSLAFAMRRSRVRSPSAPPVFKPFSAS